MRKHLPYGENAHNLHPDTLECPVCSSKLIPAELIMSTADYEMWYVECRSCQTEYITRQKPGKLVIPTPITREYILSLEHRIETLEKLISQTNVTSQTEARIENDISKTYAFLLNT